MLICDQSFHAIFIQQSSGREDFGEMEKYSQKNAYVRIAYNT